MSWSIDQILPSIQSLGVFGYWIIAAASMLEAYFITGVIIPGTLVVDAGGVLVQRGVLDFFDLVWFVAIGSVIGGEASYWTGRLARSKLRQGSRFMQSRAYARAQSLFARRGGLALVVGRFFGPVAGLVPLVAALAGVERRTFVIWNLVGSVPYALVHVAIGYSIGGALGLFSDTATRIAVLGSILALLLFLIWWLLYRLFGLLPLALSVAEAAILSVVDWPPIARWLASHPNLAAWLSRRFDKGHFWGLPVTCLAVAFGYVLVVWADVTLDFIFAAPVVAIDQNVAAFVHLFWSPAILRGAAHVTALGDSRVVGLFLLAALVGLLAERRWPLMIGLTAAVAGNVLTVAALKLIFARPRPVLGYFVETSGSFPSGHAAISVAFYGTLLYALARSGRVNHVAAIMLASILAFAIGVSRLLLIEHFLSDVLNGWLIGSLWLLVGVTIAEWLFLRAKPAASPRTPAYVPVVALIGVGLLIAAGGWKIATYDKARLVQANLQADLVIASPGRLLSVPDYQNFAETLTGEQGAPINLVVVALDETAVQHGLTQAGWSVALAPAPGRLIDLAYATVRDQANPDTMVFPLFWAGMPNDFAMISGPQDPTPSIVKFWRTQFVTGGRRIFVASVMPDDRSRETALTADDFATARDRLSAQLAALSPTGMTLGAMANGSVGLIEIP